MIESKLVDLLTNQQHFYLLLGIVSIIYILKQITPISTVIFSDKWKWCVGPLNVVLSSVGIFVLNLTPAQDRGTRVMILLIISAFATFAYELIIKHLDTFVRKHFATPDPPVVAPPSS